ncbi:MAG: 50S ribosomal protein L24 [Schleiferiaceae bacterium]|jgi:large subunit ribosomal protein L24|nr:50S ribosomal protein L24 [Schleiferiaceae bacterium]MDR9441268.1 50S ribosomal protein L24 [Schleiferiaceae bacterium]
MKKFHIRKGDTVQVTAGEDKGEMGKVLELLPKKDRAIVEGVNVVKRHQKPSASNPDGGIRETEASIHLSNLMLIDPKTNEPTRVGRKLDENGNLVRFSKKTQEIIK